MAFTLRPEMEAKARIWLRAGVPLVWVIWQRYRSVDVWRRGEQVARHQGGGRFA